MDVLKYNFYFSALLFFGLPKAWASPPTDLSNPDQSAQVQKNHVLNEDDLVYTDVSDKTATFTGHWGHVLTDVLGRSLPHPAAKALAPLSRGERVEVIRLSKDKRWYAVMSLRAHRKVWIPRSSVKVLPSSQPRKSE